MVEPAEFFRGRVLIAAPHQDDAVLGCGGTIARLPDTEQVHVLYATDGSGSPAPVMPWRDAAPRDLAEVRMGEAKEAMAELGVSAARLQFLGFPDGDLERHKEALHSSLTASLARIRPDHVLVPFRYDRQADHLTLHRAMAAAVGTAEPAPILTEYFVYHRSRLLPSGDVRDYVQPRFLFAVDTAPTASQKRAALDRFRSQTTRYYEWQTRANLSAALLDEVSATPELFVRCDPSVKGTAVFARLGQWIRLAHWLEPRLKKPKDEVIALVRRAFMADG